MRILFSLLLIALQFTTSGFAAERIELPEVREGKTLLSANENGAQSTSPTKEILCYSEEKYNQYLNGVTNNGPVAVALGFNIDRGKEFAWALHSKTGLTVVSWSGGFLHSGLVHSLNGDPVVIVERAIQSAMKRPPGKTAVFFQSRWF